MNDNFTNIKWFGENVYQQMVLWRQMPLTGYWENRTSALIKFYIYIYMMFCLWFGPAQKFLGLQFLHFSSFNSGKMKLHQRQRIPLNVGWLSQSSNQWFSTHFGWVVISLSIWSDLLTLRLDLKVWLLDGGNIVQSEGKVLSQGEMAWQCHDGTQIWILMLTFSLPFSTPTSETPTSPNKALHSDPV